jgi:hypothetical protein
MFFQQLDHPVLISLDFAKIVLSHSKVLSLASYTQLAILSSLSAGSRLSIYVVSDRVAQLYPQAPGSFFVTFYDSQV